MWKKIALILKAIAEAIGAIAGGKAPSTPPKPPTS
jgi:hypothetical protein